MYTLEFDHVKNSKVKAIPKRKQIDFEGHF